MFHVAKNGRFVKGVVGTATAVCALIVTLRAFGFPIPDAMWGMALSALIALAKMIIPSSEEKMEYRQPAGWKLKKMIIEASEE